MRIQRLDLTRFGKFTDHSIDFGDRPNGEADLHIIYGPNEAGKSTLMAAWLDFLFGIPLRTTHNFKHDNATLQVGARLQLAQDELKDVARDFVRIKKKNSSLLGPDDNPVNEHELQTALGNIGRESYRTMFSLDDQSLEEGGNSILKSEGDLGKLLYSATSGVARISESLQTLHEQNDEFYRRNARKGELKDLKEELHKLELERSRLDTQAGNYKKLVREHKEADSQYAELARELDKAKLEVEKLSDKANAYPRLRNLLQLQLQLSPMTNLPDAPDSWSQEVHELEKSRIQLNARQQTLDTELQRIENASSETQVDGIALSLLHELPALESAREKYIAGRDNLPELELALENSAKKIQATLANLDSKPECPPDSLLISSSLRGQLMGLIEQHPVLLSSNKAARKELRLIETRHNTLVQEFAQWEGKTDAQSSEDQKTMSLSRQPKIDNLTAAIAPYSHLEYSRQHRTANMTADKLERALKEQLAALHPWQGTTDSLLQMQVPHQSVLSNLKTQQLDLSTRQSETDLALRNRKEQLRRTEAEFQAFQKQGLLDDSASAKLRLQRDQAWREHRATLSSSSADAFEKAMRQDDTAQETRLRNTESLAKIGSLQRAISIAKEDVVAANNDDESIQTKLHEHHARLSKLAASLSPALEKIENVESLEAWLEARQRALQTAEEFNSAQSEKTAIEQEIKQACDTVSSALLAADIQPTPPITNTITTTIAATATENLALLDSLIRSATTSIEHERSLSGLRNELDNVQQQLAIRQHTLEETEHDLAQWQSDWKHTCGSTWLADSVAGRAKLHERSESDVVLPSPGSVNSVLQDLEKLQILLTQQNELKGRFQQQQGVISSFEDKLAVLAQSLELDTELLSTEELYSTIKHQIETANADQQALTKLQKQIEGLQLEQSENKASLKTTEQNAQKMTDHFSVDSLHEVAEKLRELKQKSELQARVEAEKIELLQILSLSTLEEAQSQLDGLDHAQARLDIEELKRGIDDLNQQLQESHAFRERAREAIANVGIDDQAAILNEQKTSLSLHIKDKASQYLQRHLGLMAANNALQAYRDRHRSSMMEKASEAFATISDGAYLRLDSRQQSGSDVLIAINKDGGSQVSDQLSKGTRFQLYLSLRMAGYLEYVESRQSVPFIADDIMETFDDKRSSQTFRVLGDAARHGQIIYLTHHQHLCDIAKESCPEVKVHQLEY